jgi:deoxyribonuclease V
MIRISKFFPEDSSRESLLRVQRIVSEGARIKDDFGDIHNIAAADQAFLDNLIISGILIMDFCSLERSQNALFPLRQ